jgi:hypothetical protein
MLMFSMTALLWDALLLAGSQHGIGFTSHTVCWLCACFAFISIGETVFRPLPTLHPEKTKCVLSLTSPTITGGLTIVAYQAPARNE